MVNFYLKRIAKGDMTVEEVPKLWREKVKKALEEQEAEKEAEATVNE